MEMSFGISFTFGPKIQLAVHVYRILTTFVKYSKLNTAILSGIYLPAEQVIRHSRGFTSSFSEQELTRFL